MGWSFATGAEIAGGADEAEAEVILPDAVDHDARGEGVVFAGDGFGKFQTAAAIFEGLAIWWGENCGESAGYFVAEVGGVAAVEVVRRYWGGRVVHCRDVGGTGW